MSTIYAPVRNYDFKGFTGRVWRLGRNVSTIYEGDTGNYIKSLEKFEHNLDIANECYEVWKSKGYTGAPSSAASFFPKIHKRTCKIGYPQNKMLQKYFKGGWVQAFQRGIVSSNILREYDLISAYLWAGSLGFPQKFQPYQKGDKNFLVIFDQDKIVAGLPPFFNSRRCIVDNEDIELYGLQGKIIRGLSWKTKDTVSILEEFYELQKLQLPDIAYKRITQSYWGLWASGRGLFMDSWKNGRVVKCTQYKNYRQNYLWSHLIMHRVARKLWGVSGGAVLVYVDSVLTSNKIQLGEHLGNWQLKGEYKKGVTVLSAGFWTPNPAPDALNKYLKHSGLVA